MRNFVLNIPHSSCNGVSDAGLGAYPQLFEKVIKWTDWHTDVIFKPNPMVTGSIAVVKSDYSRFLIDVERLVDDPLNENGQGIVYTNYEGTRRNVSEAEAGRLMDYYFGYINRLKEKLSADSVQIDCHSFPSDVCEEMHIRHIWQSMGCTGRNSVFERDMELDENMER